MPVNDAPIAQRAEGRGPHAQPGRRAEQHGNSRRNDGGVNARDQRHAGQCGIGHTLRQQHQADNQTRPEFTAQQGGCGFGPIEPAGQDCMGVIVRE